MVAGQLVAGRYELEELVGRGGMSAVYRARDRVLDRRVALKMLHEPLAADEDYVERFRREARAAAQLNHPNIVTVIDRGEDDGRPFIVFEYVKGDTLKSLVADRERLSPDEVVELGLQIGRALEFAHERGVVHRDVKPQNVLLDADGRARVTDFGIARSLDGEGLTLTGTVLGTSDYMSPEQARGEPAGESTDVYSLGALLYELLTGEVVFSGSSLVSVALKHVNEPPPPVVMRAPGTPPRLAAVIDRCLEKDPADRFASMAELVGALEACRAELRSDDREDTFELAGRIAPPRRRLAAAVFVAALAALAGAVAILVAKRDSIGEALHVGKSSPAAHAVRLTGAGSYDPFGDNGDEHGGEAPLATDHNPATAWTTESYNTFAKPGVGLVLAAPRPVALSELTVRTDTPGFLARIRAGTSTQGRFVYVSDRQTVTRASTFHVDTHGKRYGYYVVWLRLPNGGVAHVNEVGARGT